MHHPHRVPCQIYWVLTLTMCAETGCGNYNIPDVRVKDRVESTTPFLYLLFVRELWQKENSLRQTPTLHPYNVRIRLNLIWTGKRWWLRCQGTTVIGNPCAGYVTTDTKSTHDVTHIQICFSWEIKSTFQTNGRWGVDMDNYDCNCFIKKTKFSQVHWRHRFPDQSEALSVTFSLWLGGQFWRALGLLLYFLFCQVA